MVLTLLKEAVVTMRLKRCVFFASRIDYSGRGYKPNRQELLNNTADAIRELTVPITVTELGPFFGLCDVFTRFDLNFARIASALCR